jgi:DNA-directed RNA polymerase subunit H (RpoH/RPB5)
MRTVAELFQARNCLMEQLETRGYDVQEYKSFSMTQVASMMANKQLDLLLSDQTGKRIFIKFVEGRPDINTIVDDLFKPTFTDSSDQPTPPILQTSHDLMIITHDPVANDTMLELIGQLWDYRNIYVSLISIPQLKFNILKHSYVPKYELLGDKEVEGVMKKFGATSTHQFAELGRHDPVAIVLGIRPGQMVKILRSSTTALLEEDYRVCVV